MNTAMTTQFKGERPEVAPPTEGEVVSVGASETSLLEKRINEIVDQMGLFGIQKQELKTALSWILYNAEIVEANGWVKVKSPYLSTSPMRKVIGLEKKIRYVMAKLFDSPFRMDFQDRHYVTLYIKTNNEVIKLLKGEEI